MATMPCYEIRIGSGSAVESLKPANTLVNLQKPFSPRVFQKLVCRYSDVSEHHIIPHIWLKAVGATREEKSATDRRNRHRKKALL